MKHPLPKLTSRRGLYFWVGMVIIIWCVSTKAYAFAGIVMVLSLLLEIAFELATYMDDSKDRIGRRIDRIEARLDEMEERLTHQRTF